MSRKNSEELIEPPETYTVQDGDTLNKIAAIHNTTPSKLAQFNKMSSSSKIIFPGQILKLPPPEPPRPKTPEPKIDKDVVDLSNNFCRINVKHITEGRGIVDGNLLLTGKIVMFEPYEHHPLVKESNVDNYSIILPKPLVVNAVILTDFQKNSDEDPTLIYDQKEDKENEDEATKETKMMYLRLRMGQPIGSKIKRDEMLMTYGENTVLPDYWFVLTLGRAQFVYDLFHKISDDFRIYGVLDVMSIERAGLELVREGRSAVEAEPGRTATRATVSKLEQNHFSFNSVDFNVIAPLRGETELMSKEERIYLANKMPQKLECHDWVLTFSTSTQGFSLANMIRKLSDKQGGLLLVLSDVENNVFGAFLSNVPSISEHFEGNGETFLFQLRPQIKAFTWTGENNFFYKVDNNSLIVGSSKGKFGLWLDRDLNKGRSQSCATFDNELLSGDSEDFTLKTLECWTFEML